MGRERKQKKISQGYRISERKKKEAVILSREDWCSILLHLGPDDSTYDLYDQIEKQVRIFDDREKETVN